LNKFIRNGAKAIMKRYIPAVWIIFLLIFLAACHLQHEVPIAGETMGTTYHIKVVTGYLSDSAGLKRKIDRRLQEINRSMSTYDSRSEISRFNAIRTSTEQMCASEDFADVMRAAEKVYRLTGGAWDGTVKPLVNLWGFGHVAIKREVPPKKEIDRLLAEVGFDRIELSKDGCLRKKKTPLYLDLNSIAKGYAVDRVAALIKNSGIDNFVVEIGGEVYASGSRPDGKPWRVGINLPEIEASLTEIYRVVNLRNRAMATSGDYRNFFEINGRRYSHVLDPHTGYPVSNSVVSVSVIADNCTLADGLATALMVIGPEKGLELVNRLDNVEALFVVQRADKSLQNYFSNGFKAA